MLVGCLPGQPVLSPDNLRFVIVAGDALAIMTFAGDCACESSSKGIDDLITGLAEVFDQPLYLFERLLPRVPEFLLGLDHRHIKPLSFLCPLPFGIDQDWLPLGNNPPIPLLPPSEVRHIPGTLPDTCVTPTIVEMRLEGCDYLVQLELPCVCDEQPTLYQNPDGERRKLANLGQEDAPPARVEHLGGRAQNPNCLPSQAIALSKRSCEGSTYDRFVIDRGTCPRYRSTQSGYSRSSIVEPVLRKSLRVKGILRCL